MALTQEERKSRNRLLMLAVWFFAMLALALTLAYYMSLQGGDRNSFLIGAAGSLGASVVFFVMFEVLLKVHTTEALAADASDAAVTHVLARMESVPDLVFPPTQLSNPRFELEFDDLLRKSSLYWVKGTSANNTLRRICNSPSFFEGKDVRILLFDSSNLDMLRDRVRLEGHGDAAEHIQKTLKTLSILEAALHALGKNLSVRVSSGFPIYRLEVFHDGLFVSFYGTDRAYPGSLLYRNNAPRDPSTPSLYRAFHRDFLYSFTSARKLVGEGAQDGALQQFSTELREALSRAQLLASPQQSEE